MRSFITFLFLFSTFINLSYSAPILVVNGEITKTDQSPIGKITVTAKNITQDREGTDSLESEKSFARFSITFIDLMGTVSAMGDKIEVVVKNDYDKILAKTVHILTAKEVDPDMQATIELKIYPPPIVSSVEPSMGLFIGGTSVSIYGGHFQENAEIYFGEELATKIEFKSDTQIELVTPPGEVATVDLQIKNPDGRNSTFSDGFEYIHFPPSIEAVSPNVDLVSGGEKVTITGENFQREAIVRFGEITQPITTFVSSSELLVIVPESADGNDRKVSLTVINPDEQISAEPIEFTYRFPVPVVAKISPAQGSILGGDPVTITGDNFRDGATLFFGEINSSTVTIDSDSRLLAVIPPSSEVGKVAISVVNGDGQSSTELLSFTYIEPRPTVRGTYPSEGASIGGTPVMLIGEHFQEGAIVKFGEVTATSVDFISSTELSLISPAGEVGEVQITVFNGDGQFSGENVIFNYVPPSPVLEKLEPSRGLTLGGLKVKLIGQYFQENATVKFGEISVETEFLSSSELMATLPKNDDAGEVFVTVQNPDNNISEALIFIYELPSPVLEKLEPSSGLTLGGSKVKLIGQYFQENATVKFGDFSVEAEFVSSLELMATLPKNDYAGEVFVTVQNPDNKISVEERKFNYVFPSPIVEKITPSNDTITGGSEVSIEGQYLRDGAIVLFGDLEVKNIIIVSDLKISLKVPPAEIDGVIEVTVKNSDGQSAMIDFTYRKISPIAKWDLNKNGSVDIFDLVLVANDFGKSDVDLIGDIDGDNDVDIFDLVHVADHFGQIDDRKKIE